MKTLLLGTALLAAVLVACGGGDSAALKAVKEDCQSPYGNVGAYVCQQALLNGAYTGDNEAETRVDCSLLDVTLDTAWEAFFYDGGYMPSGRVTDLYKELCEEDGR